MMRNGSHPYLYSDDVQVNKIANGDNTKRVVLHTLKLGQLREPGNEVDDELFEVRWYHRGEEQAALHNQFEIDAKIGTWSVSVQLTTTEVRNDPNALLQDTEHFTVTLPVNSTILS